MESVGKDAIFLPPAVSAALTERSRLTVTLLGPLRVSHGVAVAGAPGSRKVRALLAYLLMAPRPLHRTKLCEMFWDAPNDPRGELRWCLSKLRGLLDTQDDKRLRASKEWVSIDVDDLEVDALSIVRETEAALAGDDLGRLRDLASLFAGEFLEGLDADRMPLFEVWLVDQREHFKTLHTRVLARCAALSRRFSDEHLHWLRRSAALRPYDHAVHSEVLVCLASRGEVADGEAHLVAATRLMESSKLDALALTSAWRRARSAGAASGLPAVRDAGAPHISLDALVAESFAVRPLDAAEMIRVASPPVEGPVPEEPQPGRRLRPAIAVLPFASRASSLPADRVDTIADGLLRDIVRSLARCRTTAVIAASSARVLFGSLPDAVAAGRLVGVAYVCAGTLSLSGESLRLDIDLVAVAEGRILRTEHYDVGLGDVAAVGFSVASEAARVMQNEIEFVERNRAAARAATDLDAWEAYHRGMWHLHRLNPADNGLALSFFGASVDMDPTFARAHAGLSFAHWLAALMFGAPAADDGAREALDVASVGVKTDPYDPSAQCALGRAFWMDGSIDDAVDALETSVALSPGYACGHYSLGIVQAFSGDPAKAIVATDQARQLSPFDPFLGAMHAARAVALLRIGKADEASAWGLRAARAAQAHPHIMLVAAVCAASAGRRDEVGRLMEQVARSGAGLNPAAFLHRLRRSGVDGALLNAMLTMQGARA